MTLKTKVMVNIWKWIAMTLQQMPTKEKSTNAVVSYCLSWFCSEIFALSSKILHGSLCYLSPREMLNKRSQTDCSCQIRTEGHVPSSHCLIFTKTSQFLITPGLFCLTWYEIHLVCYQLGACCILSFLGVECAGQGHNKEVWLDHMGGHEWGEEASGS